MSTENSTAHLFQGLVISLASATMQHLGKTLNPLSGKIEKDLEAAQGTIDMLDMLEAKTRGNLDDAEAKLLKGILAELKLNYVETMNEKPSAPAGEPAGSAEPAAGANASEMPSKDSPPEQAG